MKFVLAIFLTNMIKKFQSKIVKLKVSKKPDKRNEDLLGNDSKDSSDGGLWNSITSTITGKFCLILTLMESI